MKWILLYGNRKCDPIAWDASTPELRDRALLALFKHFKDEWQFYADLEEPDPWDVDKPNKQKELYALACKGDAKAAKRLLGLRQSYEYESFDFMQVRTP